MLYLLDANVLIDANRDYYPLERVPEFWEWLRHQGQQGAVAVPFEIFDEIREYGDALSTWIKSPENRDVLVLDEEPEATLISRVVNLGYGSELTEDEVEQVGRDPFLIAYALQDPDARVIVTTEVSRPSRQRANRHIPDVCDELGVRHRTPFQFIRELDFRTDWR